MKWQITFNLGLSAAKNTHYIKKSCSELNSIQKSLQVHLSISHRVKLGAGMIDMVEILYCTEMANYIYSSAEHCPKYAAHQKKFVMKNQLRKTHSYIMHKNS